MHELSIATTMADMAVEEADRLGGAHVLAVHLKLGPLSGVVKDALLFSWDVACEDTPVAGAKLLIEEVRVVVRCDVCAKDRTLDEFQRLQCPVCGTHTPQVLAGDELEVTALEVAA